MSDGMRQLPPFPPAAPGTRVSVVVPCYNYGRYVEAAVRSALDQRGVEVDVTIVDDASSDDSVAVARRLVEADSRVRLVVHETNRGHVETYNEALALATGEFVVKLDADDLLTPGSLARSASLMSAHPEVAFCYGRAVEFTDEHPPVLPESPVTSWTIWEGAAWLERVLRRGHNVILQPEVFLRRSAVEATGGYRTRLRWAEDYNWWLRLAASGAVGRVKGPAQGLYRVHGKSLQRSVADIELADLGARADAVDLFFAEEDGIADSARLRRIAYASLTRNARELSVSALRRPDGGAESAAEFRRLAARLERSSGGAVIAGPTAWRGPVGRVARDLQWRLRWRRWNAEGV